MPSKGKLRPREIKLQARVSQPIHGRNGVKKNTIQPLERLNWKGSSVIFKNDFALSSPGQRRILKNRDVTGTRSWVQEPQDFLPAMQNHVSLSFTTPILKTFCWTTELIDPLSCSLWLQLGFTNNFLCQCSALGSLSAAEACLLVLTASGRS